MVVGLLHSVSRDSVLDQGLDGAKQHRHLRDLLVLKHQAHTFDRLALGFLALRFHKER